MRRHSRLPRPPAPDSIGADERKYHDRVTERTERVHGTAGRAADYFAAISNTPPVAAALTELGTQVRKGGLRGTYTDAERELMDIVLAVDLGSNAILQVHIPDAVAVGVPCETIRALIEGRDHELGRDDAQIVAYARQVVGGAVTDASYAALVERFGARGAVELTALIGFLLMTIRLWQALGVPEPTPEEIHELLDDVESGSSSLPDPGARIG